MTPSIGVIGAGGKVGSSLAAKAREKNALAFAFSRKYMPDSISEITDIEFFPEVTFIAVSDSAIREIAERIINETKIDISGKIFAHCAGSLSVAPLNLLKENGAIIAAAHPYQTFFRCSEDILNGIAWGIECEEGDFEVIAEAVKLLEGVPYRLPGGIDKQKYHASAVAASNFATCAIGLGRILAEQCGLPLEIFLSPILKRTLDNNLILLNTQELPLSGPIARGDAEALARHLESMKDYPEIQSAYRDFAAAAQVIYKLFLNQDFQE